jgi:replication initiator protein RepSA
MTDPARVGELLPEVLQEVVQRAGHGYDRWAELVAQAGYCHHPIRLLGRVEQADRATGEVREVYDSDPEPDGVLLKACGTRRESRCPSCAAVYRADAYQLLAAGLKGGKGVPESIAEHPRLFVTFTAPSFGRVHSRRAQGRLVLPCHPYRQGATCPHGTRAGCWHRHDPDDPRLGEPLCPQCYEAQAQVVWNALAPELWRYTTTYLNRTLARLVGCSEAELRRLVRVSYAKVAEFQRRGAIHFHAILRLDAATECRCPACLAPPPEPFTASLLELALRDTVAAVRVPCPPLDDGLPRFARWGSQLDVRNITKGDQVGELSAEQVAGYVAKYATKATETFGSGLDHRLTEGDLARLELPAHVAELVRAAWELGARPSLGRLRLRAWAHMLGFRGHWSTKSRRYSTTMTALRRARVQYAKRRRARDGVPLDAWGRAEDDDDQAVVVLATWSYTGSGYQTQGEVWLALSAAARARERRRIAREELTTTTMIATAA